MVTATGTIRCHVVYPQIPSVSPDGLVNEVTDTVVDLRTEAADLAAADFALRSSATARGVWWMAMRASDG